WLYERAGVPRSGCLPLLLERARLHAALSRWDDAEMDLEEFFRRAPPGSVHLRYWTQANLMLGFLRERRGDAAGARAAWRRGLPGAHPEYRGRKYNPSVLSYICELILASLTGDVSDANLHAMLGPGLDGLKGAFDRQK